MSKFKNFIEENKNNYSFKNPNILADVIAHFQKIIEYAYIIEGVEEKLKPRMILGDESEDNESDKTRSYDKPVLSITLSKRMSCGTNETTIKSLFNNNLIAGAPKFIRRVKESEDVEYDQGVFFTDNELCLTLKTKTVKEQITILNLIERALNIYSISLRPKFITVCGIKEIKTEEKKDSKNFETAKIYFQLRLQEIVNINNLYLLKGFQIFTGTDEIIDVYSGKLDKEGNWNDNVQETDYEYFV